MNFEKVGKCYFKLLNKKTGKSKPIYVSNYEAKKNNDFLEAGENEEYFLIPNKDTEREIIYISGQSGAGKSYFVGLFSDEYHKMFPSRKIYLFSLIDDDISVNRKFIGRIDLNKFLNSDVGLADFKDSLVIYDDIDCIKNKKLKDKMKNLENSILLMGRHHNISFMYCSHLSCTGSDSKNILNECHRMVMFPLTMPSRSFKYLTENYVGLDKEQRKEVLNLSKKSRSVCYIKSYPPILFSSKKIMVLNPSVQ